MNSQRTFGSKETDLGIALVADGIGIAVAIGGGDHVRESIVDYPQAAIHRLTKVISQ